MYYVGEKSFATLELAKRYSLEMLIASDPILASAVATTEPRMITEVLVNWLETNAVAIVDILTTTPTSKPKARKANGGTKVRKPKVAPAPEPQPPTAA